VLLLLAGCDDPCRPGEEPTLRLGAGLDEFAELDGELLLEAGPQGGLHTWLAVAATDLSTTDPWRVELRGLWGGTVIADARPVADASCQREIAEQQAVGLQLIWVVDPAAVPSADDLDGELVDVDVVVTDAAGTRVSDRAVAVMLRSP